SLLFLLILLPPSSTLFPYTTLFRSSDWNPEFFRKKAAVHGEHVLRCVEFILTAQDYPEIGYKRALGVIQLHRPYRSERLDAACKDRKSTRLNSSHVKISYAVFCLKK